MSKRLDELKQELRQQISRKIAADFDHAFDRLAFGALVGDSGEAYASTAAAASEPGLTFDDLLETQRKIEEIMTLYYATEESIPRGDVLLMKPTKWTPECFVCHPDDLEAVKAGLPANLRLKHLRDHRPDLEAMRREVRPDLTDKEINREIERLEKLTGIDRSGESEE